MDSFEDRKTVGHSLLHEDDVPCIWMAARLIGFRLCDRCQECETCPLDRALRRADLREEDPSERPSLLAAPWEFPDDRLYHSGHTWALDLGEGRCRCGADALAARLLSHATSVVIAAQNSTLHRGGVSCWFGDDDELIPLRAPISGTVLRRNRKIQERPELLASSPYDDGWLFEIQSTTDSRAGLLPAERVRQRAERQMRTLNRHVERFSGEARRAVGVTLADGGQPLTDARKILGPKRYRSLVARFLN